MTWPTVRYAALNAAYWAQFCLALAFSSAFLLARGLGNAQIGLVLALAGIGSALLQPLAARHADRSRLPLRWWVSGFTLLLALGAAVLLLPGPAPLRDAIAFGFGACMLQSTLPLVNALGMQAAAQGVPVDFGPARAVGSLAFAATSLSVGALVAAVGADVLPWLILADAGLIVLTSATFAFSGGRARTDVAADEAPEHPPLDGAARLRFVLLLVGVCGLLVSHAATNSFVFQIVSFHGGTARDLGTSFTIAAVTEILPMVFFARLLRRWSAGALLRFAAVVFAVKAVATWLAPGLGWYLATQLLQLGGFALFVPASVYYVERLLPRDERVRGQASMTLAFTVGNVIAGLGGGVLLDVAGVPAMLFAGAVAGVLGMVGVLLGRERTAPVPAPAPS